jgi:hypothetical protein
MAYETKTFIKMMCSWKRTKRYRDLMFSFWLIKNKRLVQSFKDTMKVQD